MAHMYLVTGASAGIGRAVAIALVGRGLQVVAVARSEDLLATLRDEAGHRLTPVVADLATPPGIAAAVSATGGNRVAGVVHGAASLIPVEPFVELGAADLVAHFAIHVATPIALYQGLSAHGPPRRMVFIDSYSATTPRQGWLGYSIIKAAAQMAARGAANELDATAVIRVLPGAVNTQVFAEVLSSDSPSAAVYQAMRDRGEVAEPDETAEFIVSLLVDADDELLSSQETWDYNNPNDRTLAS